MAKAFHTNKQSKKQALLSPKEKKAKKLAKKNADDTAPIIVRPSIDPPDHRG